MADYQAWPEQAMVPSMRGPFPGWTSINKSCGQEQCHAKIRMTYLTYDMMLCADIGQSSVEGLPVMKAGPNARAGFMHMLLVEPSSQINSGTNSPTASGPSLPQPLQSPHALHSVFPQTIGGQIAAFCAQFFSSLVTVCRP